MQRNDEDMKEAKETVQKLEEARIVLNRLLGPGGAFSEREYETYLRGAKGAGSTYSQVGPRGSYHQQQHGGAPLNKVGMTAPSNKALSTVSQ